MFAYCRDNPVMNSDPNGEWVVDAAFLVTDIANLASHPSIENAGWVLFSAMCFADPSGLASSSIHIARTARALKETSQITAKITKSIKISRKATEEVRSGNRLQMNLQMFGKTKKMGKINGKAPRSNQAQNKQFKAIVKEFDLSKKEQRRLHDSITGQGFGYDDIRQEAISLFSRLQK
jgi:hypothetical protein